MSDHPEDPDDEAPIVNPQPARNLRDHKQRRQQLKQIDNEADLASKFWRDVLGTTVGRREMWSILRACAPEGSDPFALPFRTSHGIPFDAAMWASAGQYHIAQKLFQSWLKLDVQGTILMLEENSPHFKKPPEKKHRGPRDG